MFKLVFQILTFTLLLGYILADQFLLTPRIAYVNTGKLMIGFSEASKVDKELTAEDEKWKKQLKEMEDELKKTVDSMSIEFNSATAARKKELQDLLSARNQQMNNFKQANQRRMDQLKQEKMKTIIDKINVYMTEYGKKQRYNIVFGTVAGGSILYGGSAFDITDKLIEGLNKRYQ